MSAWPEYLETCPHGTKNPKYLCLECQASNEMIDLCRAAHDAEVKELVEALDGLIKANESGCAVLTDASFWTAKQALSRAKGGA